MKYRNQQDFEREAEHWHGAAADTWFSHIALNIPGEGKSNEWFEVVDDAAYAALEA